MATHTALRAVVLQHPRCRVVLVALVRLLCGRRAGQAIGHQLPGFRKSSYAAPHRKSPNDNSCKRFAVFLIGISAKLRQPCGRFSGRSHASLLMHDGTAKDYKGNRLPVSTYISGRQMSQTGELRKRGEWVNLYRGRGRG